MIEIEQKHAALLQEAQRRGQLGVENMRLCFEVLALAAAIDRACAHRLAPHGLSEGKFVLLFLLHGKKMGYRRMNWLHRLVSHERRLPGYWMALSMVAWLPVGLLPWIGANL